MSKVYKRGVFFLNNTPEGIQDSIYTFQEYPELHKEILRNHPRYFAFVKSGNHYLFGLSKFCAFKDIDSYTYVSEARYATDGGNTQNHISKITGKKWQIESEFDLSIRKAFRSWIERISSTYVKHRFSLMEIVTPSNTSTLKRKRGISPEELFKKLEMRRQLGLKGENFAMKYETRRLVSSGCKNPFHHIDHVSKKNAAGFDILSFFEEDRYIEVKATTKVDPEIYLTKNEYKILKEKSKQAFLYIVQFQNDKTDPTIVEINNPIAWLEKHAALSTQIYMAKIENKKL